MTRFSRHRAHRRSAVTATVFASALSLALGGTSSVGAVTVDGLNVTFNALPQAADISGLNVSYIQPGAVYNGYGSNGTYSQVYYGQTNPFVYLNGVTRGSSTPQFDSVYNGDAVYQYAKPLVSFGLLWGTVDGDNTLAFFDNTSRIGAISGADLITAIEAAGLSSSELYGSASHQPTVDITVTAPSGTLYVAGEGASDLTFEYSNIEAVEPVASATPEPATWAMLLIGMTGVGATLRLGRRRSSRGPIACQA